MIFYRNTLSWFKEHASEKTKSLTERLKGLSTRQMFRQTYLFFVILKSVYFQFYGASVHSQEKFQSKSCHRSVCVLFSFYKVWSFFCWRRMRKCFLSWVCICAPERSLCSVQSHFEKLYQKMSRNLQNIHSICTEQLQGVGWSAAGFLLV